MTLGDDDRDREGRLRLTFAILMGLILFVVSVFVYPFDRSTELQYHSQDSYEGINGLKFVTADSMLKEMDDCFCINGIPGAIKQENGCLHYGAMDLSSCVGELTINSWLIGGRSIANPMESYRVHL